MSLTLVQSPTPFSATGAPLASLSEAFSPANVAQNFLLCAVILQGTGTNNDTIAVSDTLHNSYQALSLQSFSTGSCLLQVFYVPSCLGGANTVTAAITGGNSTGGIIFIREWGSVGAIDSQNFNSGSGTGVSSGDVTTAQAIELVYGIAGINIVSGSITSVSAGSGYTVIASSNGGLTVPGYLDEYQITAAAGTFNATGSVTPAKSTTVAWGAQVVTFVQALPSTGEPRVHVQHGRGGYGPHRNWQGPVG